MELGVIDFCYTISFQAMLLLVTPDPVTNTYSSFPVTFILQISE